MPTAFSKVKSAFLRSSGSAALIGTLSFNVFSALAADEQSLSLFNVHNNETLDVVYKRDGKYVPDALKKIDHLLRDRVNDKMEKINPATLDRLYLIGQNIKSRYPDVSLVFHVYSGYRSPETNQQLRNTAGRGGQAVKSRHMIGDALDFAVPGVPNDKLFDLAWCTSSGGTGYYIRDNVVHIDSGKKRYWYDKKDADLLPRNWNPHNINCDKI